MLNLFLLGKNLKITKKLKWNYIFFVNLHDRNGKEWIFFVFKPNQYTFLMTITHENDLKTSVQQSAICFKKLIENIMKI